MSYYKKTGRVAVAVNDNGMLDHSYGHGCTIECPIGWNDDCPIMTHTVSVEELRDLRYLLDRAIAAADERLERHLRR